MAKKHEEEDHGESAPMWIVSFADLVTLMLSFFVILAAGNNKDSGSDPEFADLVSSLKAAFHNVETSGEASLDPKKDFNELVRRMLALQEPKPAGRRGDANSKGMLGKHLRVTRIRDGLEVVMGGPVYFEPFSAKPTEEGVRQLEDIVRIIKGRRNVIEIRGHVGERPWPSDWDYNNVMKLAYDRADFVGRVLTREGVDPRALRLMAVGPNEPMKSSNTDPGTASQNRRVEIIVRESLIDDYTPETPARLSTAPAESK